MQPLNYLNTAGGMIWTAACALLGVLLTWLYYRVINRIPATWLCDYNETPSAELLSGNRVRYAGSGIIMSVVTVVCLILCRLQYNKGFDIYFVVFSLIIIVSLMIAICDIKYTIIPDQFTALLAVLGLGISIYDIVRGFGLLHTTWWSPLAGAAMGAGVMIIIDLIGMLVYKKTGMGFGDVKLFAAVGLITGFPGTIIAFIISMITAMVCFCVILLAVRIISRKASKAPLQEAVVGSEDPAVSDKQHEDIEKTDEHQDKAQEEANSGIAEQEGAESVTQAGEEGAGGEAADAESGAEGSGSYLAFGPYIALSLICYLVFNDFIYYLVEQYLKLF